MKRFLKRMNRGIVLGAILAVAMVIYVAASTAQFKKSQPELEDYVTQFMADYAAIAVTPEDCRTTDLTGMTEAAKTKMYNSAADLYNRYYASAKSANEMLYYYGLTRDELLSSYKDTLTPPEDAYMNAGVGYVTEWSAKPQFGSFSFKKIGSNMARAICSFNIEMSYVGNPYVPMPGYPMSVYDFGYYYNADGTPFAMPKDERTGSLNVQLEFTLKKGSDGWKLVYTDSNGWDADFQLEPQTDGDTPADDLTVTKGEEVSVG